MDSLIMKRFLLLSLILLASGLREEAAENFSEDELMEGIATEDDDTTLSEVGETESDEDTFLDLESLWTGLMEDAGDADDSSADEIAIEDIEILIEELEETNEDLEDFETVTIDEVTYTKEELEAYIASLYEDIVELELSDALIDLEVLIMYAPDPGNLEDFNDGMAAAELLIQEMIESGTETVLVQEVEYTVEGVEELMEGAMDAMENVVMDIEADDLNDMEIGTTEDSMEDYMLELQQVMDNMEGVGDKVVIDGVPYMEEDLQEIYDSIVELLEDLDEGDTIEDEAADVEEQLAKIDVSYDDYEDEIEEIQEVIAVLVDTVVINGVEYDEEGLEELIDNAEAGMQDLDVQAQIEVINGILEENTEEQRLSYDKYLEGIAAVEELIDIMEPDDIAMLDGDDYTEDELQALVDMSALYNGLQHINAAVLEAEANILSDPPTSDELQLEIEYYETILEYIAPGGSVIIDGVTYKESELQDLTDELNQLLQDTLDTESLLNELGDVQVYLEIIDGTATEDELERLVEELEELQADMEDGDVITTADGETLDDEDIGDIIDDTQDILEGLDDGETADIEDAEVAELELAFLA